MGIPDSVGELVPWVIVNKTLWLGNEDYTPGTVPSVWCQSNGLFFSLQVIHVLCLSIDRLFDSNKDGCGVDSKFAEEWNSLSLSRQETRQEIQKLIKAMEVIKT